MAPGRPAALLALVLALGASCTTLDVSIDPALGALQPLPSDFQAGLEYFPVDPLGRWWVYRYGPTEHRFRHELVGAGAIASPTLGAKAKVRVLHIYQGDALGQHRLIEGLGLSIKPGGVYIVASDAGLPGKRTRHLVPESHVLEWPLPVRPGTEWDGRRTHHQAVGLGTIQTPAGTFEDCLVVCTRGPVSSNDPTVYEGLRYYARGVGLVYETLLDEQGEWRPILLLERWGVRPEAAPRPAVET